MILCLGDVFTVIKTVICEKKKVKTTDKIQILLKVVTKSTNPV